MVAPSPSSSPPVVCAVLADGQPALDAAVAAQDRAPDTVLRNPDVLSAAPAAARGATWLWLLDGSVLPHPGALAALLRALDAVPPLPAPVLLTGKVVRADGTLAEAAAPWPRRDTTDVALLAVTRHLLPVRAARGGSLLVTAEAVAAAAPPRPDLGAGAAVEWTARLLRGNTGFLVPNSLADARPAPTTASSVEALSADPEEDLAAWVAMASGRGWSAKEKLWLTAEGLGRARGALVARRTAPRRLVAAAAIGLRAAAR